MFVIETLHFINFLDLVWTWILHFIKFWLMVGLGLSFKNSRLDLVCKIWQ